MDALELLKALTTPGVAALLVMVWRLDRRLVRLETLLSGRAPAPA